MHFHWFGKRGDQPPVAHTLLGFVSQFVTVFKLTAKMTSYHTALYSCRVTFWVVVTSVGFVPQLCIEVEDILNAQYLPSTLLLEDAKIGTGLNLTIQEPEYPNSTIADGNIHDAYLTMQFHRSMMNEYLCRGYLADEILTEMGKRTPAAERRQGLPAKPHRKRKPAKGKLMEDEGSSSYKDWLTRSTLMDDVYRHYDQVMSADGSADGDSESLSIESGEVTGYAVQGAGGGGGKAIPSAPTYHPHQVVPANTFGYGSGGGGTLVGGDQFHDGGGAMLGHFGSLGPGHHQPDSGSGGGMATYGVVAGGGMAHSAPDLHHSTGHYHPSYSAPGYGHSGHGGYYHHHPSSSGKEGLSLKDLFDLALTALAFLAFGLFIMHLILTCITGPVGPTVVMNTTTTTTTTTGRVGPKGTKPRLIRSAGGTPHESHLLNELAYRVLTSIDRMVQLYEARTAASGRCLRYTLCDNNKYSRSLQDPKSKIWLPVWSFGVSWMMGRLGEDRLEGLRAAVLGLANANCNQLYPYCSIGDSA